MCPLLKLTLFYYAMTKILNIQTNTATLVIYDLMSLKHRINDDADWWSLSEDEVEEINKGNVLFLNLGDDGSIKYLLSMMLMNIPGRYF